jgi:acylphosphatase
VSRAIRFRVHGRVQGVGFRAFTVRCAEHHELAGWCRNDDAGTVSGEAEGADDAIDAFLADLRRGPRSAWVERVDDEPIALTGPTGFQIHR